MLLLAALLMASFLLEVSLALIESFQEEKIWSVIRLTLLTTRKKGKLSPNMRVRRPEINSVECWVKWTKILFFSPKLTLRLHLRRRTFSPFWIHLICESHAFPSSSVPSWTSHVPPTCCLSLPSLHALSSCDSHLQLMRCEREREVSWWESKSCVWNQKKKSNSPSSWCFFFLPSSSW